ncbi:MAG: cell wall-active antibiotics response protein [Acidimicrobiia bacterium]|nr:cell wall-active antibiotics response protein [Acidimicrobiia bacterium]
MNSARFFFGILLVSLGAVLALGAAEVIDSGEFISQWWPAVLVAAALVQIAVNPRHWLSPLFVGGLGVVLLLNTTETVDADVWPAAWAALLVVAGIGVLIGSLGGRSDAGDTADRVREFTAFGGRKLVSHSKSFEGGTLGAIFGGTELDLRDAELAPGASIDVFAAFGGAEIRVPVGWRVDTHGLPLFGGFENEVEGEGDEFSPALDINATVLFGGLEVKH